MTPTQCTLAKLKADGYIAVVERWNPYARIRQDLFGIVDIPTVRADETLAVQTTAGLGVSARVARYGKHNAYTSVKLFGRNLSVALTK